MPKKSKSLCVDDLRHAEYYDMQTTFDTLYQKSMDGEKFEGGSTDGQGTDLVLGSGSYIDGFEDGVVGHKVGETFDLNLKFPDDYKANTELAGKDVTFEVTLNGVYK